MGFGGVPWCAIEGYPVPSVTRRTGREVAKPQSVAWALEKAKLMHVDPFRPIFVAGGGERYFPKNNIVESYVKSRGGGNYFNTLTRVASTSRSR
jgi:hypothetical protein